MREHHSKKHCKFHSSDMGRMRGYIQPWLMLLLIDAPSHGYQLLEKLNQNEDTKGVDPGLLYRTLRKFEDDGLVTSSWDTEGAGASRRVYTITEDGIAYLDAWIQHVRNSQDKLSRLINQYESINTIKNKRKEDDNNG